MFYKVNIEDHVRVPPNMFGLGAEEAIQKKLSDLYEGYISKELGIVIDVISVSKIYEGVIIPGDGAIYYKTEFSVIVFKPEMQEVLVGSVRDIADFGVFLNLGAIEGMIHISQTMDDFVTFGKDKVLLGKETKNTLKVGDICRAKVVAISYKDLSNPRIGLTMRSKGLGKLEWLRAE